MAPRKRRVNTERPTKSKAVSDSPAVPAPAPPEADPASEPVPPEESSPKFPIVGIGASAGGLAAYEAFFSAMPSDTESGMAFVLIQHLAPDHKSILGELIGRYTPMQVYEVTDGMEVQPNTAYIIPPNRDMALVGGTLRLYEPSAPRGQRLPIDFFFRSLAREHHERAICLVLSGTGSDGTLGLRAVKGEGGMAMAQAPDTTEHDGMPRSAIATGLVDYVLPPAEMPAQLIAYARHAFGKLRRAAAPTPGDDGMLRNLTSLLRSQTGHDFSQYKATTLVRRMQRRMALHQIEQADEYFRYARENPAETEALFRDLLIGVTNFFRDPEAFRVLEDTVIPRLFQGKSDQDLIRVWVCGCSTGEEAYSIAILLQERMDAMRRSYRVQIFATDIDGRAIDHARAGVFPASIAADVTPERLQRFFSYESDHSVYRVQKPIRDMLVFSEQDLIKDPPFSKLDLISCRNLLIYLNAEVQRKLIPLFHYALRPTGFLFLGTSETIGEFSRLFSVLDRKAKLYASRPVEPGARPILAEFVPPVHEPSLARRKALAEEAPPRNLRQLTEQALLAHYAEAGILVNGRGEILHIFGRTGKYLEPPTGEPALNILAMAREGLRRPLMNALHKAVANKELVEQLGIRVKANGEEVTANLTVRPAGPVDHYLVMIKEVPSVEPVLTGAREVPAVPESSGRVVELEQELRAKEEYLQTTLEEMETTNEELKSTNEEMQSVNEELQSTNEELETSKEELQSVNEELSTLNAELQDKVADLSRANSDMNNLLAGTGIGTVYVDHELRVARFTPAATQVLNLIATDVGRPVEHIVPNVVGYGELAADVRQVLDSMVTLEREVRTKNGAWYLMRIRPYRTLDNVIEGVVLTFVDISERKRAEDALRESQGRFHTIFNQAFAGIGQTDPTGRFVFVNDRLCEALGYPREELMKKRLLDLVHPDDLQRNRVLLAALAAGGPDFSLELRDRRKDGTPMWVSKRVSAIRDGSGAVQSLVAVSSDISERKRLETEAAANDDQLKTDLDALSRLEAIGALWIAEANRQAVLEHILDEAIAVTGADKGTLQLCVPPSDDLAIVAQRGFEPAFVDYWNQAHQGKGACGVAAQAGSRVVIEDITRSPIFANTESLDVLLTAGVRAIQSTPLVGRSGTPLGVLSTHLRAPGHFVARALRFLDLLIRQATDILERARQDDLLSERR